jgi:hypothetical protein
MCETPGKARAQLSDKLLSLIMWELPIFNFRGSIMNKLITLACMGIMLLASSAVFAGPQQQKMKSCNKEAKLKLLKGDKRKAFMKNCLSNKAVLPSNSLTPDATQENKQAQK